MNDEAYFSGDKNDPYTTGPYGTHHHVCGDQMSYVFLFVCVCVYILYIV